MHLIILANSCHNLFAGHMASQTKDLERKSHQRDGKKAQHGSRATS
jgi:hypothetical protein